MILHVQKTRKTKSHYLTYLIMLFIYQYILSIVENVFSFISSTSLIIMCFGIRYKNINKQKKKKRDLYNIIIIIEYI